MSRKKIEWSTPGFTYVHFLILKESKVSATPRVLTPESICNKVREQACFFPTLSMQLCHLFVIESDSFVTVCIQSWLLSICWMKIHSLWYYFYGFWKHRFIYASAMYHVEQINHTPTKFFCCQPLPNFQP